jgi:hypothetical protein
LVVAELTNVVRFCAEKVRHVHLPISWGNHAGSILFVCLFTG